MILLLNYRTKDIWPNHILSFKAKIVKRFDLRVKEDLRTDYVNASRIITVTINSISCMVCLISFLTHVHI